MLHCPVSFFSRNMRSLSILLLGICLVLHAKAQKSITDSVFQIEAISVTAQRPIRSTALTRTVVDSAIMAESSNATLAELLQRHTPIFVKSYGGGSMATVSFRGTAASHTQVEWNGVNINSPMLGQVDFSLLPVWMVDNLEVLHGGSSLSEGSGALGGSVLIGSAPRWNRHLYGAVEQDVASFGALQTMVALGGGGKRLQVKARYIYDRARNDYPYFNTAILPNREDVQTNADYVKQGGTADLFWRVGHKDMLTFNSWFHTAQRNLPTIMSYEGKGRDEHQRDAELRMALRWNHYGTNYRSELVGGYTTNNIDYYLANQTDMGLVLNLDSKSRSESLSGKYKMEYSFTDRTMLRLLANLNHHSVSTLNRITAEGYSAVRTEAGASLSLHHRFSRIVALYGLVRGEFRDGSFAPVMPSLGVEVAPLERVDLLIKVNATRNYHAPTLNDLYWLPGGNPQLEPEQGYTGDMSLSLAQKFSELTLRANLTGYASLINNWIVWRPSEFRYWTAENIREVFARGVEADFELEYGIDNFRFSFAGNYAYTRTTNQKPDIEGDESGGKQLIYIPEHKANIFAGFGWRMLDLRYTWSLIGERYTTSSNEATRHTLPLYTLHDMSLGGNFKIGPVGLRAEFHLNNLFDTNYQAILWRAMPGRNYRLMVRLTF